MTPTFASSEALAGLIGIRHGFFGRAGGVSGGDYRSLNCGPGSADDPGAVTENRARAMAALGLPPDALYTARQVHGTDAIALDARGTPRRQGDALATASPVIALGILTADCAPVLFADPGARVVGAAHAGWRGALDGVLGAAVSAMEALGAERGRIVAAVGPCIGLASYEVGPEFPAHGSRPEDRGNARWFTAPCPGERPHFDLEGYVGARAFRGSAWRMVTVAGADTCADEGLFFSYRRARLRGEAGYGRALSAIALGGVSTSAPSDRFRLRLPAGIAGGRAPCEPGKAESAGGRRAGSCVRLSFRLVSRHRGPSLPATGAAVSSLARPRTLTASRCAPSPACHPPPRRRSSRLSSTRSPAAEVPAVVSSDPGRGARAYGAAEAQTLDGDRLKVAIEWWVIGRDGRGLGRHWVSAEPSRRDWEHAPTPLVRRPRGRFRGWNRCPPAACPGRQGGRAACGSRRYRRGSARHRR